jgi:hypothetical protein
MDSCLTGFPGTGNISPSFRFVKQKFALMRCYSLKLLAQLQKVFHLLVQKLAVLRIQRVETIFVHEHQLRTNPFVPTVLASLLQDLSAQLIIEGWLGESIRRTATLRACYLRHVELCEYSSRYELGVR